MTGVRYAAMTTSVARARADASSLESAVTTDMRVSGKLRTRQHRAVEPNSQELEAHHAASYAFRSHPTSSLST